MVCLSRALPCESGMAIVTPLLSRDVVCYNWTDCIHCPGKENLKEVALLPGTFNAGEAGAILKLHL